MAKNSEITSVGVNVYGNRLRFVSVCVHRPNVRHKVRDYTSGLDPASQARMLRKGRLLQSMLFERNVARGRIWEND